MKNLLKHGFNLAACAVGGTGTVVGALWTFGEAVGFPNGIVHGENLIQPLVTTAVSALVLTAGYFRLSDRFFSPKANNGPA